MEHQYGWLCGDESECEAITDVIATNAFAKGVLFTDAPLTDAIEKQTLPISSGRTQREDVSLIGQLIQPFGQR